MTDKLTTSRIRAMARCPRLHQYKYEIGVRPERDGRALRMGSLFHEALHAIKQGHAWDDVSVSLNTADMPELEVACVRAMVTGWLWRWANDPMEVLASERSYEVPLINPASGRGVPRWRRAGQIDGIVVCQGQTVCIEHKTTSDDLSFDSLYWKRLRMDVQCSNYVAAAKAMKYQVVGVLYDVVRKPTMTLRNVPLVDENGMKVVTGPDGERVMKANGEPRQSADKSQGHVLETRTETVDEWYARALQEMYDNPDKYFARRYVARLDSEEKDADRDNYEWMRLIATARKDGLWPRNTSACSDFGVCPYFDVCADGIDLTQEIPEGMVMLDNVHPELKEN